MAAGSSFGTLFRLSTFGESHGVAIGGVIDGVPSNIEIDIDLVQQELDKRKPGQSNLVTQRKESDSVVFLSGIFEGKTTGSPIGFMIQNENQKSKDYSHIKDVYRPSHADYVYTQKYGNRDYRGGGRSSARETASRVVAGSIAKQVLKQFQIEFITFVDQVGNVALNKEELKCLDLSLIESNPVRCPDQDKAKLMEQLILKIKKEGDTIGGTIRCIINNIPVGLGEPVFERLNAQLAKAMFSINAVKGFEIGSGFGSVTMKGSEHNDLFNVDGSTKSNNSGGIQGGISNGMPIEMRVAFKPVATVIQKQDALNGDGEIVEMMGKGRHDPCVVPRAVPIVEAMAAMVILDNYLMYKAYT